MPAIDSPFCFVTFGGAMIGEALSKLKNIWVTAAAILDERSEHTLAAVHRSRLWRFAHFWVLVAKSFNRNRCPVHATALAYATLLALIPMLAVVVSISASLLKERGEKPIEQCIDYLVENVIPVGEAKPGSLLARALKKRPVEPAVEGATPGSEAAALAEAQTAEAAKSSAERKETVKRIKEFIDNIRSGTLGVTGMVALVMVAIMMLARIEETFNDIWGVTRGRSWLARIVQYWAAITLGPLLLIVALGLATGSQLTASKERLAATPFIGGLVFQIFPLVVLALTFALFYKLMPNTKVNWRAALAGGAMAGGLWHLNNVLGVVFVSRIASNNKIYGSLGVIPVVMIGLYFSWMILLFGAQISYAWQNRNAYLQDKLAENVHQRSREFIALRLMTQIGQRFQKGASPPSVTVLAEALAVPSRLVSQLLTILVNAQMLVEVANNETAYTLARPPAQINCQDILQALRTNPGQELPTREDPSRARLLGQFEKIQQAERSAAKALSLESLLAEAVVIKCE